MDKPSTVEVAVELIQLAVDELAAQRAFHQRESRRLDIIINGIQATAKPVMHPEIPSSNGVPAAKTQRPKRGTKNEESAP